MIFSFAGLMAMQMMYQYYMDQQNQQNQQSQQSHDQNMANFSANVNKDVLQNRIQWATQDAEKAGIHPLAALGVNPASGPNITASRLPTKKDFIGQNLMQIMNRLASQEQTDVALQKEREELKRMRLLNVGLARNLYGPEQKDLDQFGTLGKGKVTPFDPGTGKDINLPGQYEVRSKAMSEQQGVESGYSPHWQYTVNRRGEVEAYISKDIAESMESDWFAAVMNTAKRVVDYTGRIGDLYLRKDKLWVQSELRKIAPKSKVDGAEFRYNPWKQTWKQRYIKNGVSKVWDTDENGKLVE